MNRTNFAEHSKSSQKCRAQINVEVVQPRNPGANLNLKPKWKPNRLPFFSLRSACNLPRIIHVSLHTVNK